MKKHANGVTYRNGGFFKTGAIKPKRGIPKCDTVALQIRTIEGKKKDDSFFTMTVDEMAAVAMLCAETVWYHIPRVKRR